jgi:Plant transposon protein
MDPSSLSDLFFEDDDAIMRAATLVTTGLPPAGTNAITSAVVKRFIETSTGNNNTGDHTGPRSKRKMYNHDRAKDMVYEHYLGPDPLYGSQFKLQFRVSLSTFQHIFEQVMHSGNQFYVSEYNGTRASMEARLLLPLKALAYGVPSYAFMDYFHMSQTLADKCCEQFDQIMIELFGHEFLRFPTADDLTAIVDLHKAIHGVDGMFGSLDCSHTGWRSCPVAWQSSYHGHYGSPSIILEAVCDHHLFIWHFAYGFAGSLNDINVMNESPLIERFINGEFAELEKEANVVPYSLGTEEFDALYVLVDGIYPSFARFVRSMRQPITEPQKVFAKWQEACRKDIERCFGVLKAQWKFLAHPIQLRDLDKIAARVYCCLLLHNMNVTARVMGDCRTRYVPSFSKERDTTGPPMDPDDLATVLERAHTEEDTGNGDRTQIAEEFSLLAARAKRLQELDSSADHWRLHDALKAYVNDNDINNTFNK